MTKRTRKRSLQVENRTVKQSLTVERRHPAEAALERVREKCKLEMRSHPKNTSGWFVAYEILAMLPKAEKGKKHA